MGKDEVIRLLIGAVFSSSVLNGIISHILYSARLKKELKHKGNDLHAKEIEKSLQNFRNLELGIKTQEIFNIDEELADQGSGIDLYSPTCIYPAILNDWDSFNSFKEMVRECRKNDEKNLSCKLALNLVFIDRYIHQLGLFMAESDVDLPMWGTIFVFDLQAWQKRVDKMLVKEINKYTYELESHETKKWTRLRKKEIDRQFKSTILNYLLNGTYNIRDRERLETAKALIQDYLDRQIENNREEM